MLSLFEIIAILLVLSAIFGWVNERFIGLPHVIGLLVMALLASIALIVFDEIVPVLGVRDVVEQTLAEIDFYDTMMNGMLAFLLFAGALQIDLSRLRAEAWAVGSMATVGVVISTFIVGFGFYLIARLIGVDIPLIWALVFGALISPTDPVAVLALLKSIEIPQRLEIKIAGGQVRGHDDELVQQELVALAGHIAIFLQRTRDAPVGDVAHRAADARGTLEEKQDRI